MLNVQDLHVYYGGIHALKGISIEVPKGKVVTLIGSNGAGKSSTLRAISGLIKHKKGTITFNGADLTSRDPVEIVKSGIVMAPEGRRIFPHLTVLENLRLGAYSRSDEAQIARDIDWIFELFPKMRDRKDQKGGTLSGGEQQMLALGRALMSAAEVVMMDNLARPGAHAGEGGLRHHRHDQPPGQDGASGRAERLRRPQDRRLRLRPRNRRHRAAGHRRGAHRGRVRWPTSADKRRGLVSPLDMSRRLAAFRVPLPHPSHSTEDVLRLLPRPQRPHRTLERSGRAAPLSSRSTGRSRTPSSPDGSRPAPGSSRPPSRRRSA